MQIGDSDTSAACVSCQVSFTYSLQHIQTADRFIYSPGLQK